MDGPLRFSLQSRRPALVRLRLHFRRQEECHDTFDHILVPLRGPDLFPVLETDNYDQ